MEATRKILVNEIEINNAKHYNQIIAHEYPEGFSRPPLMPVPRPLYKQVNYRFKVNLVNSFYVEDEDNKEANNDIVANILYEGIVRLGYAPHLLEKLKLVLNGD